jgi:chromosome segregation ATPase
METQTHTNGTTKSAPEDATIPTETNQSHLSKRELSERLGLPHPDELEEMEARISELETETSRLRKENEQLREEKAAAEANAEEQANRRSEAEEKLALFRERLGHAAEALNLQPSEDVSVAEEIKSRISDYEEVCDLLEEAQADAPSQSNSNQDTSNQDTSNQESPSPETPEELPRVSDAIQKRTGEVIFDGEGLDWSAVWSAIERVDEIAAERNEYEEKIETLEELLG